MATFTFSLREMVETFGRDEVKGWFMDYELADYLTTEEINVINARGTWSKEKLADKIIDHYYMHESGQETPALFIHYAKVAMREIMEEKLPLIYSMSLEYNPLNGTDYTEEYTAENVANTTKSGKGITLDSDTPQGKITKSEILNGEYVSRTSGNEYDDRDDTTANQSSKRRVSGATGSNTAQKLIEQYRKNIVALDKDIIKDIGRIFHGVLV